MVEGEISQYVPIRGVVFTSIQNRVKLLYPNLLHVYFYKNIKTR